MLPKIYPVTCHTNHVGENSIFVAIKGFKDDGKKFIETYEDNKKAFISSRFN